MNPSLSGDILTVFSLASSVASLALAVLAIWIALHGKREVDRTNQKTQDLLTDIRTDAKLVAQYAIPELRAYGDSVRKFVFDKADGEPGSSSLLSRVETIMGENMRIIRGEIASIRDAKDLAAVRRKLHDLEAKVQSSQDTLRESVAASARELLVDLNGKPSWGFRAEQWPAFLGYLYRTWGYSPSQYGRRWVLVNPATGQHLPEAPIVRQLPFSELGIEFPERLDLVELSG